MVSAPSGRICKKNARAARTTTEIRIVIHSAVVPSSRMHPPSLSLFLADTRDLVAPRLFVRHLVRSRTSFLLRAPPTSSAFCFLLSNVVAVRHPGSHPGAKCDTRRSLVNVRSTMEKSCVYDVVSSTESNFYLKWKRPHVCAWTFLMMKELMTKHRNCVFYKWTLPTSFKELHTRTHAHTIYPSWVSERTRVIFKCI